MKSYYVHYKNKYPAGHAEFDENRLDVYDGEGKHIIALRKNGAGALVDQSKELGLDGEHDLAPIPRDARVWKLAESGQVEKDEEHEARSVEREAFMEGEKVLSMAELLKKGFEFDAKGNVSAQIRKA